MARINLRPWREELRKEKQKQFVTVLFGAVFIAAGLVLLWQGHVNGKIDYQKSRNSYLQNAMKELDARIEEIQELRKRREELLSRMTVIQDLQGKRPVVVRQFDEMVRTLPDGLYYKELKKVGDQMTIAGMAESNNRISTLMRSFEASSWFASPNLTNVAAADKTRAGYSEFNMTVMQKAPTAEGAAQ